MDEKIIIKSEPTMSEKVMRMYAACSILVVIVGIWYLTLGIVRLALFLFFMSFLFALTTYWSGKMQKNCGYTITDKRIYGTTMFGSRIDLPIDSISSVQKTPFFFSVATSSERIYLQGIKNRDAIYKAISDLLIERQNKSATTSTPVVKQEVPKSNADELKKYKELLDMGAITQDEFDEKKKQLLNL